MTEKTLDSQVAVITGGSRGIGREVARALAMEGAKVAVTARNEEKLAETVQMITDAGGVCTAYPMDVTDAESVQQAINAIVDTYGKIDLLVNNAGIGDGGYLPWDVDIERWWQIQEVNVKGVFMVTRAIVPAMVERGSGRVINMGSLSGTRPSKEMSAYSVSKTALMRFTDSCAAAAEDTGVSFFAISPGLVLTDMTDHEFFEDIPAENWTPIEKVGVLCVNLARGLADKLTGRFIHAEDDFDDLVARADEIVEQNLHVLKYVT